MAKSTSKVIPGSSVDAQQWRPPSMDLPPSKRVTVGEKPGSLLTADQLEQLQKAAYDEGFEQGKRSGFEYGHKEGLDQGRDKIQSLANQFDALLQTLDRPLANLDEQVERELLELVIATVKQLVRREIRTDTGQIVGVVREALAVLPVASRHIRVVLHPDDAVVVRDIYATTESELGWIIVEDPVLERGGCRVLTDISQIDATLESRLAALIAPLLGDRRDKDEPGTESDA